MASGELQTLKTLIGQFAANIDSYKSPAYDETTTRIDFINKFFSLLGWDMDNTQGYSEDYREVIHEDTVRIDNHAKAPDYSFRIGGQRKFFVEAKKPSVNIREAKAPAYQVRRYGYTAKLPLSILTDFEEFAVYDTRIKPHKNDNASVARVFYCRFEKYQENWDEISGFFSKKAVLGGSFDKYVEKNKHKKGASEVDKEFLKMIEGWRSEIARSLALRNKNLSVHELNYAVTKIIDRIIFLRIAEDRQTEPYGALQKLSTLSGIYPAFDKLCREADAKYNSGLLKIEDFLSNLKLDDKILKNIFKGLYYPDCPYEFSVLGVEILGQIYEQFLGKTIRLTKGHQAKVEEKPEVRKAGGVYYTPQYIVEYIVKNTVGEKLKGQTPKKVSGLTICDPACGSGSFLIGAFDLLLKWHLEHYTNKTRLKKALKEERIYQFNETTYRLTIREKRRILLNNIYGVDIDRYAVEVTKLSLLLKLMENENQESAWRLFKESQMQILPDLSTNIKCGNSLIGPDFYDGQNFDLFDDDQMRKINVFDWQDEFPEIFEGGGFDVVIGNPPYVDIKGLDPNLVKYYFKSFPTVSNRMNLYAVFVEKALELLTEKGQNSFIIPSSILMNSSYQKLRKRILENSIKQIIKLPDNIFEKATVETAIYVLEKNKPQKSLKTHFYPNNVKINSLDHKLETQNIGHWFLDEENKFNIYTSYDEFLVIEKIKNQTNYLENFADFSLGLTPYDKYRGHSKEIIEGRKFHSNEKIDESYKPLLNGSGIKRFFLRWNQKDFIKYGRWLGAPREERFFKYPHIVVRQIVSNKRIYAGYTEEPLYNTQIGFNLIVKEGFDNKLLLALLNSNLISWFHYKNFLDQTKKVFQKILIANAKKLPVPNISLDQRDKIISYVDQMLKTQEKLHAATFEPDRKMYQRRARALDKKIDRIVYDLYGLTPEEIKIIEAETSN